MPYSLPHILSAEWRELTEHIPSQFLSAFKDATSYAHAEAIRARLLWEIPTQLLDDHANAAILRSFHSHLGNTNAH
jgi:hypothetical protein